MENRCYGSKELLATALVRDGTLGEVVYCHDARKEICDGVKNRHCRLRNYLTRNCDNYPTHSLGPIAKILNINRGNRMLKLVSMASKSRGVKAFIEGKEEYDFLKDKTFAQGDVAPTMITCADGTLITLKLLSSCCAMFGLLEGERQIFSCVLLRTAQEISGMCACCRSIIGGTERPSRLRLFPNEADNNANTREERIMKKPASKFLALVLGLVLLVSMLPAASASGDDLRTVVVNQTQRIMDVTYTIDTRVARADISGDAARYAAYHEGGILPIAYFEYNRLKFPIKGVMMEANGGTYEAFVDSINQDFNKLTEGNTVDVNGKIPKYGDIPGFNPANQEDATAAPYVGMDMNSFLTDIVSRVTPNAPTSVKEALTHEALVALLPGANLSAASSKAAISDTAAARAAYGKLAAGDLLLAWDDNAVAAEAAKVHTMVVKEVSGDQVTVMYPGYSQPVYTFRCDKCGVLDYEGPTSAATPVHVVSNAYYRFKSFTSHKEVYADASCTGRWQAVTGTTWRTETVSYDALLGENGASVPYASAGYLPYTLAAYTSGSPAVSVKGSSTVTAGAIAGGFTAKVSSNYRLVGFEAVLTAESGYVQRFSSVAADWKAWEWDYSDSALDLALMDSEPGKYKLELYAVSGPTDASGNTPKSLAYSMEFTLTGAAVVLSTNKQSVPQGETVTVSLNAQKAGMTAIKTVVSYDPAYFVFDAEASKAASPNVTFIDNGDNNGSGSVSVRYAGGALNANTTPVKMYFNAMRTGNYASKAENMVPFKMLELSTSTAAGATDAQLEPDRADGLVNVSVGFNTLLYKNYVGDNDLLLVFFSDCEVALYQTTELPMLYDGKLMEEVTQAHYLLDGVPWTMCFGHIGPNLNPLLVTLDESDSATISPEIEYWAEANLDVNESGFTDISDAQMIANIYNGKVPLEDNVVKWLRADINRDGKVDVKDRNELLNTLFE